MIYLSFAFFHCLLKSSKVDSRIPGLSVVKGVRLSFTPDLNEWNWDLSLFLYYSSLLLFI
jgi:hypothetical protein